MTPEHALIQLLKLEALSFDDIVKYTAWTHEKTAETIKTLKASGAIEWKHKPSRYAVPAVPKPKRSPVTQRLQPAMPAMWGDRHSITTTHAATPRGQNAAFAGMVSRLCEARPQRSGAQTAGEGVASE